MNQKDLALMQKSLRMVEDTTSEAGRLRKVALTAVANHAACWKRLNVATELLAEGTGTQEWQRRRDVFLSG